MLEKIGFLILMLGLMMGESESLLIPAITITLGAVLLWLGIRTEEARHEE